MSKKRMIQNASSMMHVLANYIDVTFASEGYDTQILSTGNGIAVQVRSTSTNDDSWKAWGKRLSGLDCAATLKLVPHGKDLEVESMAAKWIDKAAAMGASWFVLWPLLFTSSFGIYKQHKLIDRMFQEALTYLASR